MRLAGAPYTRGCEIMFIATVANPRLAPGPGNPGYGIAGAHRPWPSVRRFEIFNPNDCICCCPDRSPLRSLSDALDAFSFAEAGGWSADLADRLRRGRWQLTAEWWRDPVGTYRAYQEAARLMGGYLTGEHNTTYLRDGHTARLADTINREVR